MSEKQKKPLPSGQRSIASFFAKTPSSSAPSVGQHGRAHINKQGAAEDAQASGGDTSAASPPPAKRARTDGAAAEAEPRSAAAGAGTPAAPPRPRPAGAAVTVPAPAPAIPGRDPVLHQRFQTKLVEGAITWRERNQNAAEQLAGASKGAKLTPLEQQVVGLKKANPGVLMAVEVGYKFKVRGVCSAV